jgi:hypothetical protein
MKQQHGDLSKGVPTPDDLNQTRKVDPSKDGTNQLRTIDLMQKSEDFDRIEKENPFVSQRTGKGA